MIKHLSKYSLLFLICLVFQILIFNEMEISKFLNPSFYVLFILLLPFETPKWAQLILAFFLGLIVDAFLNTQGMNAAASTLMAFVRPGVLNLLSPREGYEAGTLPRIFYLGFVWFLKYSLILIFIHQLALYFIEAMSFNFLGMTLTVALTNTLLTAFFVIISQFIMFKR